MKVAENNMSFESCTQTTKLCKLMFQYSVIVKDMQHSEKMIAYDIT